MNLFAWLNKQARWSNETFGRSPRPLGIIAHIEKELDEIRADPTSLEEWIDVAMLAMDGARRAGHTPHEICKQFERKQAIVMARTYPKTEDHVASEHQREPKPDPRPEACCGCPSGIECPDCPGGEADEPYWKMNHPVTGLVVPALPNGHGKMAPAIQNPDGKWVIE